MEIWRFGLKIVILMISRKIQYSIFNKNANRKIKD